MVPLPSVFISHGSPMHALEAGAAGLAWAALGKRLGKPKAILIASAHWETNLPMVTGAARPETIHDFSGFPAPPYRIRYTAPGPPAIAQRAPHATRAHPTDEHFLPLFFALGAARDNYQPERIFSAIDSGVLSMDAYVFH